MKKSYTVFFILLVVASSCRTNEKITEVAERVAVEELSRIVKMAESESLLTTARSCTSQRVVETQHGELWISSGITAEFFDPETYRVEIMGKDHIFPLSIMCRVENAEKFLDDGYETTNEVAFVYIYDRDPGICSWNVPKLAIAQRNL